MIHGICRKRNIKVLDVFQPGLKDARMQNMVVLANIEKNKLIPGIKKEHYYEAMEDLMQGTILKTNLKLFDEERNR
jgi:hypothetical protein